MSTWSDVILAAVYSLIAYGAGHMNGRAREFRSIDGARSAGVFLLKRMYRVEVGDSETFEVTRVSATEYDIRRSPESLGGCAYADARPTRICSIRGLVVGGGQNDKEQHDE